MKRALHLVSALAALSCLLPLSSGHADEAPVQVFVFHQNLVPSHAQEVDARRLVGIRQPDGSKYPILLITDGQKLMGVEMNPDAAKTGDSRPTWESAMLYARDLTSLNDATNARYFAYEDTDAEKFIVVDVTDGKVVWEVDAKASGIDTYQQIISTDPAGQRLLFLEPRSGAGTTSNLVLVTKGPPEKVHRFSTPSRAAKFAAFTPDGTRIVYTYGEFNNVGSVKESPIRIAFVDPSTMTDAMVIDEGLDAIWQFTFSPDGKWLGLITESDFRVYDVGSGKLLKQSNIEKDALSSFIFAEDSMSVRLISIGSEPKDVEFDLRPPTTPTKQVEK